MSRHRNVRSMNYADEYDGYDDVYGHSVEDDYSISPSDAGYVFDRNQKSQMSAFMTGDEDIAEEDESVEEESENKRRRDSEVLGLQHRNLSEIDEARMRSCLDEIRNVIGDSVSEATLADVIFANDFDVAKSLDSVLSSASSDASISASKPKSQDTSVPREPKVHSEKDDSPAPFFNLNEKIMSNHDSDLTLFNQFSQKPAYHIPKLNKVHSSSGKESVCTNDDKPKSQLSFTAEKQMYDFSKVQFEVEEMRLDFKPLSESESANAMGTLSTPSLFSKKVSLDNQSIPKLSALKMLKDSKTLDEECSSLSALMAQHSSKSPNSENTTLSALAALHLKSSSHPVSLGTVQFVIPSLAKTASPLTGHVENSESLCTAEDGMKVSKKTLCDESGDRTGDGFVIDLLSALNPPDVRKELQRPQSRNFLEDFADSVDSCDEPAEAWLQDRSCILNATSVLLSNFIMEEKKSSPLGRILCRRRHTCQVPYIKPLTPFRGSITPFMFNTPSPDRIILSYLRRT